MSVRRVRGIDPCMTWAGIYPGLYPDMRGAAGHERAIADDVAALPIQWRADVGRPADLLAVVGIMVLSAARRHPLAWDGARMAVVGTSDPVAMLASTSLSVRSWGGTDRIVVHSPVGVCLSMPEPVSARLWGGQVTTERIWSRGLEALGSIDADGDMSSRVTSGASATGYDSTAVGVALRDGFSASAAGIAIAGRRPGVEMASLLGAAWIESRGWWPSREDSSIPDLRGVILRDALDLDRWCVLAVNRWRAIIAVSGRRMYIDGMVPVPVPP